MAATCRRTISPAPATQPARHSNADIAAGAALVLAAITAVAGALILRERSDGLVLACAVVAGAIMVKRAW